MYKHLFGPVPSRRLGMSLGVDLVPHKVCSLDCVYCECGATTKLTTDRKEYVLYENVVNELNHYFANNPDPDYITFSGAGEPTLNISIGKVLDYIKELRPEVPVALLTNATLFYDINLRNEILKADVILPSLDAATQEAFENINRPSKDIDIDKYINGLVEFRKEYNGKIWLEVFFLKDCNDDLENIKAISDAIFRINPDKLQLNTLDRPGTVNDIIPLSPEELYLVGDLIGFEPVEVIASFRNRKKKESTSNENENNIREVIKRRPCTIADISHITGMNDILILEILNKFESEGLLISSSSDRGIFYRLNG